MTLEPSATERGLWLASPARSAGVHALIIGISSYPYLKDGTAPRRAPLNANMGQLEVSAKTAAKVFAWLRTRGSAGGASVASCRLCLAPRAGAEEAAVAEVAGANFSDGRFSSLRQAVEGWESALAAGGRSGDPNVAFFFFAGHGLEHLSSPALLAEDILNPDSPRAPLNAIAFNSLWQSVKTYGIDRAFFFVDACRNAPELAKTLHIVGEDVLKPVPYPGRAPDAVVCLYATRLGEFAYQVKTDPASIFGRGLLEALEGLPPDHAPYDVSVQPWQLIFGNLESYVKQRVRELILPYGATILQPVEPHGWPYNGDALVAQKPPDPMVAQKPPGTTVAPKPPDTTLPRPKPMPSAGELGELVAASTRDEDTRQQVAARANAVFAPFHSVSAATIKDRVAANPHGGPEIRNYAVMHEIFQHESVTDPWLAGLEILDVRSEAKVDDRTVTLIAGSSHEVAGELTAWLDLSIAPQEGESVWIGWRAPNDEGSAAVVAPRDAYSPLPLRLDLSFRQPTDPSEWRWQLQSMTARIGEPTGPATATWQSLWNVQRIELLSDIASAARAAEQLQILERSLFEKLQSPVAAALAASLLLRAGALERLHDWPRNLADWVPWLADGPILWAETLLQRADQMDTRQAREAQNEARKYFALCAMRGAPVIGSVLAMAARQAVRWQQFLERKDTPIKEADNLSLACARINRASEYAVSGAVFAAFVSASIRLTPAYVLREGAYSLRAKTSLDAASPHLERQRQTIADEDVYLP